MRELARLLRRYRTGQLQDLATANWRENLPRSGWIISVTNATLRARQAAIRAVHLEPRRIVSRLRSAKRQPAGPSGGGG